MVRFTAYDTARMLAVILKKLMYRTRIEGLENVPATGALIAPNHVSYADGLLVGLSCRAIRGCWFSPISSRLPGSAGSAN